MKALIIVAHGSRRQVSNDEVNALTEIMKQTLTEEYPIIETGFLELANPPIPEAIEICIEKGATDICVIPYFLSTGTHVQRDIPEEINKSKLKHKNTPITLLPHIGGSAGMRDLIKQTVLSNCEQ